jgi:hypothetical protein
MMMREARTPWRVTGAILGVSLAVALLVIVRPGAAGSPLPAALRVTMAPAGELEVSPAPPRPLLVAGSLRPGGRRAVAAFRVRDQTGASLALRLRADPDSTTLDGLLRLRLLDGRRVLADTTLEGLALRPAALDLRSGEGRELRLEAWLPRDILSGYAGQLVRVALVPRVAATAER